MELQKQISSFIGRHHVLTLATSAGGMVHCSNMFYAWDKAAGQFVFTSAKDTLHAVQALENPVAAASIVLETRVVGRLQGLQLRGHVAPVTPGQHEQAKAAYIKRFPYAALAELELWVFTPDFMKLTDNTLGFGKKIIWQANE